MRIIAHLFNFKQKVLWFWTFKPKGQVTITVQSQAGLVLLCGRTQCEKTRKANLQEGLKILEARIPHPARKVKQTVLQAKGKSFQLSKSTIDARGSPADSATWRAFLCLTDSGLESLDPSWSHAGSKAPFPQKWL